MIQEGNTLHFLREPPKEISAPKERDIYYHHKELDFVMTIEVEKIVDQEVLPSKLTEENLESLEKVF